MHSSATFLAAAAALLSSVDAVPQQYGGHHHGGCKPKYTSTTSYAVMSTTLQPYGPVYPTYSPAPNPNPCDWERDTPIGLLIVAPGNSALDGKFVSTAHAGALEEAAVVSDNADVTFRLIPGSGLVHVKEAGGLRPMLGATFPSTGAPGESVVPMSFDAQPDQRGLTLCVTRENDAPFLTIENEQEWFACNPTEAVPGAAKQIFTSKTAGGRIMVPDCQAIKLRLIENHEKGLIIPTEAPIVF